MIFTSHGGKTHAERDRIDDRSAFFEPVTVMMNQRYVLCRPDAGLNDTLCQIELMHRYAICTNRTLIVDTAYDHALYSFHDHFSNYFQTNEVNLVLNIRNVSKILESMTVFPEFLFGRVNSYHPFPSPETLNLVDLETREPLNFDINARYAHQLLVCHGWGGGQLSLFCLTKLKIVEAIRDALLARIEAIGAPFSGIHIRNTDHKTNYVPAIQRIKEFAVRPIFVATDSLKCREYCIREFGEKDVRYFSTLPEYEVPIHSNNTQFEPAFKKNSDAILHLLTLALSTQFHRVSFDGSSTGPVGGYTFLAENLVKHDGIVFSLLGEGPKAMSIFKKAMEWRKSLSSSVTKPSDWLSK